MAELEAALEDGAENSLSCVVTLSYLSVRN